MTTHGLFIRCAVLALALVVPACVTQSVEISGFTETAAGEESALRRHRPCEHGDMPYAHGEYLPINGKLKICLDGDWVDTDEDAPERFVAGKPIVSEAQFDRINERMKGDPKKGFWITLRFPGEGGVKIINGTKYTYTKGLWIGSPPLPQQVRQ